MGEKKVICITNINRVSGDSQNVLIGNWKLIFFLFNLYEIVEPVDPVLPFVNLRVFVLNLKWWSVLLFDLSPNFLIYQVTLSPFIIYFPSWNSIYDIGSVFIRSITSWYFRLLFQVMKSKFIDAHNGGWWKWFYWKIPIILMIFEIVQIYNRRCTVRIEIILLLCQIFH